MIRKGEKNMRETKETVKRAMRQAVEKDPATMLVSIPKEVKEELINIARDENSKSLIKFLTDQYYQAQSFRIKAENQARAIYQDADQEATSDYPDFIRIQIHNAKYQEALNKKYLDIVTDNIPVCRWMKSIKGIGPTMSAYLYSRLDPTNRYGSDFISYAGLNDNNVPWLGKDKAKSLVKEIKAEYEELMSQIENIICEIVGADHLDDVKNELLKKMKKDKSLGLDYDDVELVINRTMSKLDKSWGYESVDSYDPDKLVYVYAYSYTASLQHKDIATDAFYNMCARRTKRKVSLIRSGTRNSYERKKEKKKYVSISDVESFLAKPPYNGELKTKMWLISDLFVKNKNRGSMYGELFDQRLAYEMEKNENRDYADQAQRILDTKNITSKKVLETLRDGKLTQAHLVSRARRFAAKLFLSHVYEAMYYDKYHTEAPQTYVIAYLGHHDYVAPEVDYRPFLNGEL